MAKKGIRVWSCFWGDKHRDLFESTIVRSLSWPLNREALKGAVWDIWTKRSEFALTAEVAKSVGISIELHEADQFIEDLPTKYLGDPGVMMNQMFIISGRRCLETGSAMFLAPVDTIIGGDSVANILQAGEEPGTVVFVIHIRVHPSILNDLETQVNRFGPETSISNARLVTLAMRHAHKSFSEAEFGHERLNTFVGGIMWKRRPNGIYATQHFLPTPYLINWTQADLDFFSRKNPPGTWPQVFGQIDHEFPSVSVYPQERARILGSSDDAFMCELTDADSNVPPLQPYDKLNPSLFWRRNFHNRMNKMVVVSLRGE